jgi:hypothetical protein
MSRFAETFLGEIAPFRAGLPGASNRKQLIVTGKSVNFQRQIAVLGKTSVIASKSDVKVHLVGGPKARSDSSFVKLGRQV